VPDEELAWLQRRAAVRLIPATPAVGIMGPEAGYRPALVPARLPPARWLHGATQAVPVLSDEWGHSVCALLYDTAHSDDF
jgi:hypothetical protein